MAEAGINAVRVYTRRRAWLLDAAARARAPCTRRPALGAARRRSSTTAAPPRDRGGVRGTRRGLRRPSGAARLRDRQRDPRADRALARPRAGSSVSSSGSTRRQGRRPGRARHLRQLPDHRVPRAAVPRLRLLQRLPRGPERRSRPTSRGCRTSPATGRCCMAETRARQPPQRRGRAGAHRSTGRSRTAFAARLRGRVRLRLDGRVAPRRPRHRRLGLRPDRPRAAPEAGAGARCSARLRRRRSATDRLDWPRISVVVCTYNGARTLRDCLDGARASSTTRTTRSSSSDDGSTDATAAIAPSTDVRLIRTAEPRALSSARNRGLEAATGEIVAYIDDDARPDPHWLTLPRGARSRARTTPASAGRTSRRRTTAASPTASRDAPGGPVHVLLSDDDGRAHPRLQHGLPPRSRCSRDRRLRPAVPHRRRRRRRLLAAAGRGLDARLQPGRRGLAPPPRLGPRLPAPAARLRQGRGAAGAEVARALQRARPPDAGPGRVYGGGAVAPVARRARATITAPGARALFQSVYEPADGLLRRCAVMPEWYLVLGGLAARPALGMLWTPLLWRLPLLVAAVSRLRSLRCMAAASRNGHVGDGRPPRGASGWRALTTPAARSLQPAARLPGGCVHGLSPWRRAWRAAARPADRPRRRSGASTGCAPEALARPCRGGAARERQVCASAASSTAGTSRCAAARSAWTAPVAVEEHGGGRQLARFRTWPRFSASASVAAGRPAAGAVAAAASRRR